ncbi:hypothetical protein M5K25_011963 [Dendrobium thyrsiflorum]|uniref:lipid-A-disaccharide synthase n=1 Tax=Dendrobium thyrsiflorum TaxID=117978 RepID=A0ABD0V442_DENTH
MRRASVRAVTASFWQRSAKARDLSTCSRRVLDMASRDGELRVFMVAGEVSGDSIASRLMASIKRISPYPVRFCGVGGALMDHEGLQSLFPMEDISVMGIFELLPYLNKIRIKLKETIEAAEAFQPHVVVTVDSKGFSFRLLKHLKVRHAKEDHCPICVHYVVPSFWAWKGGERRLGKLSEFVDHLLCILPFEEEICRLNGLAASYVGHPLLEDAFCLNKELDSPSYNWRFQGNGDAFRQQHEIPPGNTVITLLPGSRLQEHVASHIERAIRSWSLSATLIPGVSLQQRYDAFSASSAALCTSGSAVMELQLAGLPSVVAYRAHFLTEWLIQHRTKLQFISLPNILLDSEVIPEVLFRSCTYKNLAATLSKVILDEDARVKQIAAAERVFRLLCPQGLDSITDNCCPSMNAASVILNLGKKKRGFNEGPNEIAFSQN